MATKGHLDLALRLIAIETVLVQIGKIASIAAGLTTEDARAMSENARAMFLKETFPGLDPALSDHTSAELADRVQGLLSHIADAVEAAYIERERLAGTDT